MSIGFVIDPLLDNQVILVYEASKYSYINIPQLPKNNKMATVTYDVIEPCLSRISKHK